MSEFIITIQEYVTQNIIEILGTIIGIIYLIQEIRQSQWMWISSIIMPIISLFVYFNAGLYADFGINIYYVIVAFYGFYAWKWGNKSSNECIELKVSRTTLKLWPLLGVATAIILIVIYLILINFTNSKVPFADSFTTALSIIAMVMLARKWIEQWWVWIVVDAVSSGLYIYKGIYGYATLYAIYSIIAIYGYYQWKQSMRMSD